MSAPALAVQPAPPRVVRRSGPGLADRPSGGRRRLAVSGTVTAVDLGPIVLGSGARLDPLVLAYRHDGRPPTRGPQILVIHALTGSADAAGDWWMPLIGPGRALDTERYGVLCSNLLGGRYGSTGPTSVDPRTGRPWGPAFPRVTTRDQARAIWRLLDTLGIERLALVTGGSLGGMVALEVALERPEAVGCCLPIAAPMATGPLAIAWNHLQATLIERLGEEGMALARQLAMTTYRSEADFDGRFGRTVGEDGRFEVLRYLEHQGDKLCARFDPETYQVLASAMDGHDIGRRRGGVRGALARLADAGTRLTGVGIQGDVLYGPRQVRALLAAASDAGVRTAYREISSTKGHDAFLVEWDQLERILGEALAWV